MCVCVCSRDREREKTELYRKTRKIVLTRIRQQIVTRRRRKVLI